MSSNPAPASSTSATAISPTTSVRRRRSWPAPNVRPAVGSKDSGLRARVARSAGMRPHVSAVSSEAPNANATTQASIRIISRRGMRPPGASARSAGTVQRDEHAGGAAGEREEGAFGEQLPHEPRPRGAEGDPYGDFALAVRCPREQQVGHVGAGHQQHEDHRARENRQRLTHVSDQQLLEGQETDGPGASSAGGCCGKSRRTRRTARAPARW